MARPLALAVSQILVMECLSPSNAGKVFPLPLYWKILTHLVGDLQITPLLLHRFLTLSTLGSPVSLIYLPHSLFCLFFVAVILFYHFLPHFFIILPHSSVSLKTADGGVNVSCLLAEACLLCESHMQRILQDACQHFAKHQSGIT